MTGTQLHWPDWGRLKLSAWQRDLVEDRSRRKLVCAGRGAGKSFAILLDALIDAMVLFDGRRRTDFQRPGPLVMMGVIGTLAFNFSTVMPLFVTRDLSGSDAMFTVLFSIIFSVFSIRSGVMALTLPDSRIRRPKKWPIQ